MAAAACLLFAVAAGAATAAAAVTCLLLLLAAIVVVARAIQILVFYKCRTMSMPGRCPIACSDCQSTDGVYSTLMVFTIASHALFIMQMHSSKHVNT